MKLEMRAVVQRVTRAQVSVDGEIVGRIAQGLCVLVGVAAGDTEEDARALSEKVVGLRIFEDAAGKMNSSIEGCGGALLAISQFTLLGDARKGKRPSFSGAQGPEEARALFDRFCELCAALGVAVERGRFRAHMQVELVNDGPVTILFEARAAGLSRVCDTRQSNSNASVASCRARRCGAGVLLKCPDDHSIHASF
jgi:D-tyrosyl-tRNA(Tyr) deacylase